MYHHWMPIMTRDKQTYHFADKEKAKKASEAGKDKRWSEKNKKAHSKRMKEIWAERNKILNETL